MNCNQIIYDNRPAPYWEAAYPIGNGTLGAMCFGSYPNDSIPLNHDCLWSGRPHQDVNPEMKEHIAEFREMINDGRYMDATCAINDHLGNNDCGSYMPAGNLNIAFADSDKVNHYIRTLNLRDGLFTVEQTVGSAKLTRSAFASFPGKLMVFRIASDTVIPDTSVTLELPYENTVLTSCNTDIQATASLPCIGRANLGIHYTDAQGRKGIPFCVLARIRTCGRTVKNENGTAFISGAKEIEIHLTLCTGYKDWQIDPQCSGIDFVQEAKDILAQADGKTYVQLEREHVADFRNLFDRSCMDFPATDADALPTKERLQNIKKSGKLTAGITALVYHFGRYLTISASRPGSRAMNLQGIWNQKLLAPWASNYTLNINTEMNYWPTEKVSLSECTEPLFRFMRDAYPNGKRVAETNYGLPGWCLHHNSDIWSFATNASGHPMWGFWNMAAAWLCRHIAEHYRFTGDRGFLKEYFPLMTSAAEFLLAWLIKKDGVLTTSPSTSPENQFAGPLGEIKYQQQIPFPDWCSPRPAVCFGSQMDLSIIYDLFRSIAELAQDADFQDQPFLDRLTAALAQMQKPGISPEGCLLEYGVPVEELDVHHRHVSHLYGAYPGTEFTPDRNPEYYEAAKKALIRRGDLSTGWAMGWRAALWARFADPEKLDLIIRNFLTPVSPVENDPGYGNGGGIYDSMLDAHPPFQIDGNFGITAALAEAFCQSHRRTADGRIIVQMFACMLPAWNKGHITGLCTEGGLTVDLTWDNGQYSAVLTASRAGRFSVIMPGTEKDLDLKQGDRIKLS